MTRFARTTGGFTRAFAVTCTLLALGAAAASLAAEPRPAPAELRLVSDAWPPFTGEAKQPRYAIELVEEALRRASVKAKTDIVAWSAVTSALTSGKADGSAAMWQSPEREEYLLFSAPLLENRLVIVGRKGSDVSAARFAELAGKRIGLVAGYAYGDAVKKAAGPVFVEGESDQANLDKLLAEKLDYMLVDELVIRQVLTYQQSEASKALAVGIIPLDRRPLHFALRKALPQAETIIKDFNEQLRAMRADGSYNRILRLRWITADIDGDGLVEHILRGLEAGEAAPTAAYSIEVTDTAEDTPTERVWIDGKTYVNWGAVPERFKVQPKYEAMDPMDGVILFRF